MDGTALNRKASIAHGDAGDPLSDEELIRKVEDCFVFGRYEMNARDFANKVFTLSDRPLATVFAPGN
jgi:hypothetical protein